MTHLAFIAASYGLTLLVVTWLGLDAAARTSRARARLRTLDPREARQ